MYLLKKESKNIVFIVGSGRCGSNLLNEILSTNDAVYVQPGELNSLWHPNQYPLSMNDNTSYSHIELSPQKFTQKSVNGWPYRHREWIRNYIGFRKNILARDKVYIIKSAMISFLIDELKLMFPEAKFIHILRFGPSVVESFVKKNYGNINKEKYDLHEYYNSCAKYWLDCLDEIDTKLGGSQDFLEIKYEDLCREPLLLLERLSVFLEVPVRGFKFDFKKIVSRNNKVNKSISDKLFSKAIRIMNPQLEKKGYI
jgi:sulfotransferase family protein